MERSKSERKIAKGTMVYRALNGLAPDYLTRIFTEQNRITNYRLRDAGDKLALPQAHTNYLNDNFSYSRVVLWNSCQLRWGWLIPHTNLRRPVVTFFDNLKFLIVRIMVHSFNSTAFFRIIL